MIESPYIVTLSRRKVYFSHPYMSQFTIEDIAQAGSKICRFAGHMTKFYSVCEHQCRVSDICRPEDKLWGLLHDCAECLGLSDVPRPLKYSPGMEAFREYEHGLLEEIAYRFGLQLPIPKGVKVADDILFLTEQRDLTNAQVEPGVGDAGGVYPERMRATALSEMIVPWSPARAEAEFLDRYYQLKVASTQ